ARPPPRARPRPAARRPRRAARSRSPPPRSTPSPGPLRGARWPHGGILRRWHATCLCGRAGRRGVARSAAVQEMTMDSDRIEGPIKEGTGKVKEEWGDLTDDAETE